MSFLCCASSPLVRENAPVSPPSPDARSSPHAAGAADAAERARASPGSGSPPPREAGGRRKQEKAQQELLNNKLESLLGPREASAAHQMSPYGRAKREADGDGDGKPRLAGRIARATFVVWGLGVLGAGAHFAATAIRDWAHERQALAAHEQADQVARARAAAAARRERLLARAKGKSPEQGARQAAAAAQLAKASVAEENPRPNGRSRRMEVFSVEVNLRGKEATDVSTKLKGTGAFCVEVEPESENPKIPFAKKRRGGDCSAMQVASFRDKNAAREYAKSLRTTHGLDAGVQKKTANVRVPADDGGAQ